MSTLLLVFSITLAAFLLVIAGMAVGVMMGRREISGSCGGLANSRNADGEASCSLCSNPDAACRELSKRMEGGAEDRDPNSTQASLADCEKDCEAEGCGKDAIAACKGT